MLEVKFEKNSLMIFDTDEKKTLYIYFDDGEASDQVYKFRFPVDRILGVRCRKMQFNAFLTFVRRAGDYELIKQITHPGVFEFDRDGYILEINAHLKVYIFVEAGMKIIFDESKISFEFDSKTSVIIGARSYSKKPQARIKITKDLRDIARAISQLSSAIKTDNCERTYPTLRGHPPLIDFSKKAVIPELRKFKSGVEIYVPPKLEYIYSAAPLVYYLLGDLKIGRPRIECEDGFCLELPAFPEFENRVSEILQQVFFLDCLVRTVGLYKIKMHEARALEALDLDAKALYDKKIQDQLSIYLEIPWERIKEFIPPWHLSTYVEPSLNKVRALPFLLNELSLIYMPRAREITEREIISYSLKDFFRSGEQIAAARLLVMPVLKNAQSHAWLSSKTPMDVVKAEEIAFLNQLRYAGVEKDHIEVALILNDKKMGEEQANVARIYKQRDDVPLETDIFQMASRRDLKEIFAAGYDMVHYIGHCAARGFLCSDGNLSATELEVNNTPAFFLNACRSYEEGMELIKRGSVCGVVTLFKVLNKEALEIGYTFARLLSCGFPVCDAVALARRRSLYGRDYLVLGNGMYVLMQGQNFNVPFIWELEKEGNNRYTIRVRIFEYGNTGGTFVSFFEDSDVFHLSHGEFSYKDKSLADLLRVMKMLQFPVLFQGKFLWSDDILKNPRLII
ncbi:MAG: hypothetical protein QXL78_06695 [Methanocellales archaeon]